MSGQENRSTPSRCFALLFFRPLLRYNSSSLWYLIEGFTLVERAPKVSASFSSRTTTSLHHLRIPQRLHKMTVCFKHLLNLPDALQIPVRESKQETESPQPIVHRARKEGNKIKLYIYIYYHDSANESYILINECIRSIRG